MYNRRKQYLEKIAAKVSHFMYQIICNKVRFNFVVFRWALCYLSQFCADQCYPSICKPNLLFMSEKYIEV